MSTKKTGGLYDRRSFLFRELLFLPAWVSHDTGHPICYPIHHKYKLSAPNRTASIPKLKAENSPIYRPVLSG